MQISQSLVSKVEKPFTVESELQTFVLTPNTSNKATLMTYFCHLYFVVSPLFDL